MTARRLQCFEGAGIEEKSHCPDEDYSIFVAPGFFVEIAGDNHFAEIVADVAKGESFLSSFLLVRNHVGGLYVYALVGLVDDKINLVLPDLVFAGGSGFERDYANINRVSSPDKFVVDDILHESSLSRLMVMSSSLFLNYWICPSFWKYASYIMPLHEKQGRH